MGDEEIFIMRQLISAQYLDVWLDQQDNDNKKLQIFLQALGGNQ